MNKFKHFFSQFPIAVIATMLLAFSTMLNARTSTDVAFEQYVAATLPAKWREFPEQGVRFGYYKYADKMRVPDAANSSASSAFWDKQLAALAKFDQSRLSASNRIDLALMQNQFQSQRWDQTIFQSWQWQPSKYNVGNDFGLLLNSTINFCHTATRLCDRFVS